MPQVLERQSSERDQKGIESIQEESESELISAEEGDTSVWEAGDEPPGSPWGCGGQGDPGHQGDPGACGSQGAPGAYGGQGPPRHSLVSPLQHEAPRAWTQGQKPTGTGSPDTNRRHSDSDRYARSRVTALDLHPVKSTQRTAAAAAPAAAQAMKKHTSCELERQADPNTSPDEVELVDETVKSGYANLRSGAQGPGLQGQPGPAAPGSRDPQPSAARGPGTPGAGEPGLDETVDSGWTDSIAV